MRPLTKGALVGAGYLGALIVAWAVVAVYVAATSGPDRQQYAAMFDFGDTLLFLGVFALAAIVPTGAALFFLRPCRPFWRILSVIAAIVAVTALASLVDDLSWRAGARSASAWSALASLRTLLAPLSALGCFLAAVFAPTRGTRIALFGATALDVVLFTHFIATRFLAFR